jgi:membrane fusion protein (multidrug efflux system)
MEYTKAQISKTEIRSPFSGVIGLRNVSLGAYVSPNMVIATLQQIDPLKIDFTIPEKYSALVSSGDGIIITVDGYKDKFKGKVYAIEPQLDPATRSMKVRGLIQNSSGKLFPGAYAKVDLGLKRIENAMLIPTQCIIPQARTKQIVVVKGGKATFKDVETDIRNENYVQITNGAVQAGDTVVATAIMYVKPNLNLKVTKIIE